MTSIRRRRPAMAVVASSLVLAATMLAAAAAQQAPAGRGQQGPPPPTGPMAPEKYKNIQVLTDVPADQLDLTMRYIVSATGIQCIQCHVQDAATGEWQYDKDDKNGKKTARKMIAMVKAINAGSDNYGLNGVNCGTCHAGNNQPRGLQPAVMMTADQISAFNLQQATIAARQGGAGRAGGGPPAGGAPPAGGGAPGGGRGQQAPLPPIDDAVNKYIEGLGGRAAIEQLQAVTITGTLMTREAQGHSLRDRREGQQIPRDDPNRAGCHDARLRRRRRLAAVGREGHRPHRLSSRADAAERRPDAGIEVQGEATGGVDGRPADPTSDAVRRARGRQHPDVGPRHTGQRLHDHSVGL